MGAGKSRRLWSQTCGVLLESIRRMRPGENRLETEEALTRRLNVSRATVREAMDTLVWQGYVTRRQGKGNFAHPSVGQLRHRMDLDADFLRLIRTEDQEGDCRNLRCGFARASQAMARRFPRPCGRVYELHWLYTLGETPMIFCKIALPEEVLTLPPEPPARGETLYQWIARFCGRDFAYFAAHLGCQADEDAAQALALPRETVVQNWQEIFYDLSDEPVAFCEVFFHPENMDLSMVLRP
ncbi:GntR family transcriptional regulator [Pseudoflavonifractor sp. 524-17]|uniref:GntR family transcriptional regulator n=1 Tax=Pseudoflavonifractor sp. 524-17 TaxID=2304577 RepID=UPI00137AC750|nr:GntR family transcriptional regulator [Pseudoflavonifractor sp. 524-17]NCE63669.1 GntR family transcriptional regulator [Pseudoflavonifractor sp. 524-17]